MATQTPTTPSNPRSTPTYKLVAARLGSDPLEFIRARRAQTPPLAYVRITNEMIRICNQDVTDPDAEVYFTHEVPRRWINQDDLLRQQAAAA